LEIARLKAEVASLNAKLQDFSKFLDMDQMKAVSVEKMSQWSSSTIVKALKFRLGSGVHGYLFLYKSGYPMLCLDTLQNQLHSYNIKSGIFTALEEPIKKKVSGMKNIDKCCAISIDEMQINPLNDYDKFETVFVGAVTLEAAPPKKKKNVTATATTASAVTEEEEEWFVGLDP